MKKVHLILLGALSLTALSFTFSLNDNSSQLEKYSPPNSGGPAINGNGDRTGSPLSTGNCANCHNGGSFSPSIGVFITDPFGNQVTEYIPGQDYIIEYMVMNAIGSPSAYGMQSVLLSSGPGNQEAGTLTSIVSPGSQISPSGGYNYYEHSTPDPGGVFQVNWTAPAVGFGDVKIYASGLAIDGTGSTSGDEATAPFVYTFPEGCLTTSSTDTQTGCAPFVWMDGNTYTSSNNTATQVLTNAGGCDSTITLDLTINAIDVSVTNTDPTLTATTSGATYLWIDCDNGNDPIASATSQAYTPSTNGSYAVIITENGCSDTSTCYTVASANVNELSFGNNVTIQPNPTNQNATLDLGKIYNEVEIRIVNPAGQIISTQHFEMVESLKLELSNARGVYFVTIKSEEGSVTRKVIKN